MKLSIIGLILCAALPVSAAPRRSVKPSSKPTPTKTASKTPAKKAAKTDLPQGMMLAPFEYPVHSGAQGSEGSPVYLPSGSSNVAFTHPVSASSKPLFGGGLVMVVDGVKSSFYGNGVTLDQKTQWMQIDLQSPYLIHGIRVWRNFFDYRIYHDVIVQLADDSEFTQNVRTVFNNDFNNSSGLGVGKDKEYAENFRGQWIPIKAQKAAYVRLYSRGSSAGPYNEYAEVEVWATAVPGMMVAPFELPAPSYLG